MNSFNSDFNDFLKSLKLYSVNFGEIVTEEERNTLKKRLSRIRMPKTFLVEFDVKKGDYVWSFNTQLIGFNDVDSGAKSNIITLRKFCSRIPEMFYSIYAHNAMAAYESGALMNLRGKITSNSHYYVRVPIKPIGSEKVIVLHKVAIPLGRDDKGNIITNLNCYTLDVSPYDEETFTTCPNTNIPEWTNLLHEKVEERIGDSGNTAIPYDPKSKAHYFFPAEDNSIFLNCDKELHRTKVKDILWIEAKGAYSQFHLANGKKYMVAVNLKNFSSQFSHPNLLRVQRSYIINKKKIDRIRQTAKKIIIKEKLIPYSDHYMKDIKEHFVLIMGQSK